MKYQIIECDFNHELHYLHFDDNDHTSKLYDVQYQILNQNRLFSSLIMYI